MDLRELIKKRMREMKISTHDIAQNTGYSSGYVYDLLKGARRFNEETEEKFCNYLGIEKSYTEKTA